jgi:hypothetical protein
MCRRRRLANKFSLAYTDKGIAPRAPPPSHQEQQGTQKEVRGIVPRTKDEPKTSEALITENQTTNQQKGAHRNTKHRTGKSKKTKEKATAKETRRSGKLTERMGHDVQS